jgi:hypothetical protein
MKSVLVVFCLPDGRFVSCQADDLASVPQPGVAYLFSQHLYEVRQVIECLSLENGDTQLMNLLKLMVKPGRKATAPSIQSLSSSGKGLLLSPDRVLLVQLEDAQHPASSPSAMPAIQIKLSPEQKAGAGAHRKDSRRTGTRTRQSSRPRK